MTKIEAIALKMGVSSAWLQGEGPDDPAESEDARRRLIKAFDALPSEKWHRRALESVLALEELAAEVEPGAAAPGKAGKRKR